MGNRESEETYYFELLNIPRGSSPQQIRAAYRGLVKKWHPDKHPPSSRTHAEAMFKAISQAYEALSDPENAARAAPGSSPCHSSGAWRPSVGGVEPRHYRQSQEERPGFLRCSTSHSQKKPPPVQRKLECKLEELCHGCCKEVRFTRDMVTDSGTIVRKEESRAIRIQPGWKKGTKITFESMGDEAPGCVAPDVVFLVSEKEHAVYKRVGDDLVLKVEVPLVNALTGWKFSFRLITGEKMSCSMHEMIIYPGYEKVVKGQGMPIASEKGTRGDLRIKFHIVFPTRLSNEQRSGIKELLKDCT